LPSISTGEGEEEKGGHTKITRKVSDAKEKEEGGLHPHIHTPHPPQILKKIPKLFMSPREKKEPIHHDNEEKTNNDTQ
jgi:hypothetical protein